MFSVQLINAEQSPCSGQVILTGQKGQTQVKNRYNRWASDHKLQIKGIGDGELKSVLAFAKVFQEQCCKRSGGLRPATLLLASLPPK